MIRKILSQREWNLLSFNVRDVKNHFNKYSNVEGDPIEQNWLSTKKTREAWISGWTALLSKYSFKEDDLLKYELEAVRKWWGPQGKTPTHSTLIEGALRYYQPVEVTGDFSKGIELFIKEMEKHGITKGSLIPGDIFHGLSEWKGDHKSNSGILYWTDRRKPEVMAGTLMYAKENPYTFLPSVLMHRYQRNKTRNVFNDDFSNLLKGNTFLPMVRRTLKRLPWMASWRGPVDVEWQASRWVEAPTRTFVEMDYKAMDTFYSFTLCQKTVLPILKWLMPSEYHFLIEWYIESVFNQDLIVSAEVMWIGLHNLFSGTLPTNDFETITNIIMQLDMWSYVYDVTSEVETYFTAPLVKNLELMVLGDDSVACIMGRDVSNKKLWYKGEMLTIPEIIAKHSALGGLVAELSKQRISSRNFFYCKRFYSYTNRKWVDVDGDMNVYGIYPTVLALNGFVNPEFQQSTDVKQEIYRALQIWDNLAGHPAQYMFLDFVQKSVKIPADIEDPVAEAAFSNSDRDFKKILHGSNFALKDSHSWQYLTNRNTKFQDKNRTNYSHSQTIALLMQQ